MAYQDRPLSCNGRLLLAVWKTSNRCETRADQHSKGLASQAGCEVSIEQDAVVAEPSLRYDRELDIGLFCHGPKFCHAIGRLLLVIAVAIAGQSGNVKSLHR
jgi:hypothetical protein